VLTSFIIISTTQFLILLKSFIKLFPIASRSQLSDAKKEGLGLDNITKSLPILSAAFLRSAQGLIDIFLRFGIFLKISTFLSSGS